MTSLVILEDFASVLLIFMSFISFSYLITEGNVRAFRIMLIDSNESSLQLITSMVLRAQIIHMESPGSPEETISPMHIRKEQVANILVGPDSCSVTVKFH